MWSTAGKILGALAGALLLLALGARRLRSRQPETRRLRSLPADLVQTIADRLDRSEQLFSWLQGFFGVPYTGNEQEAGDAAAFAALLKEFAVPEEELADLLRTAGAIEKDALLVYAVRDPQNPAASPSLVTVCRNPENTALLVGIFRPASS